MQTLAYGLGSQGSELAETGGLVLQDTYRVGRQIGRGGMGLVCEATHARLPGRFAVKFLLRELVGNPEAFGRFCREAEIMSQLRHPNIVQILDFNSTPDGIPYFVMEYLEGIDLGKRLEDGEPMPLTKVIHLVEQVASALGSAHARGVVHRDLKPPNIFLVGFDGQPDEFVKVLDFGISKIRSASNRLSIESELLGTPQYMAPEQALGQLDRVNERSDQFSLAAITYAMLTGHDPFVGDNPAALLYQVVHEAPPPLAHFISWDTSHVQRVLGRAMAKDQDARYDSILEFSRALEDASNAALCAAVPVTVNRHAQPVLIPKAAAALPRAPLRLSEVAPTGPKPIATAKRRSILLEDGEVAGPVVEHDDVDPRARTRRAASHVPDYEWDLPSSIDRIPISAGRAVALAGIAAALAGVMVFKGWYREVPSDVRFFRDNAVAMFRPPAALPQPAAFPVAGPLPGKPEAAVAPPSPSSPQPATAEPTTEASAEPRPPARPEPPAAPAAAPAEPLEPAAAAPAEKSTRSQPPRRRSQTADQPRRQGGWAFEPSPPRTADTATLPPAESAPPIGATPSVAPIPAPPPAPSGSSGFSIAPPSTEQVPDDIMPITPVPEKPLPPPSP